MKLFSKTLIAAALSSAALASAPVSAQVSGNIAVVDATRVVASTAAFRNAYQQIGTTFQAQATQIQQKSTQRQTLLQQLDTNNDGQFDQTEQQAAQNAPQAAQIRQLETEIEQLSSQIEIARVYAIEQILQRYPTVVQNVVQQNSIQILLSPEAVSYAPPAATINQKVVTAMDAALPSVQTAPPANYQPSRNAVAVYQDVQGLLALASAAQAQQAQQGQAQQPAAQQPSGR